MNKIIPVIAIVFAFTLGTIFSADLATAVKPVTEVFVTNPDPIQVEVTNIPEINDEVLVVNTEPIEVTGSLSADPVCPSENIQHWMNVRVLLINEVHHPSEPTINTGERIFLPIPFSGSELFMEDHRTQIAIDRLTELGYTNSVGNPITSGDIGTIQINADEVGYSTICAEN